MRRPRQGRRHLKTWFITGVSRGLGLALAQAALDRGDTVVGTVRSGTPELNPGAGALHIINLDMADGPAIDTAVGKAFDLAGGRLDVLVNNAGYGLMGAAEDATDLEIERLFAVDVFGPIRLIRAALPRLRARGAGHIINITSIAGRAPSPGAALYAAAKHALEGFSAQPGAGTRADRREGDRRGPRRVPHGLLLPSLDPQKRGAGLRV